MGVLVVGWGRRRTRLPRYERRTATLLATQAGRILERVRDEARLAHQADTDPPNRRRYNRALEAMFAGDVAVLLDLDNFKAVNDRDGHAAGDHALITLAECLRTVRRDIDCVARYGGEEFAMVLAGSGLPGAHIVLDRLRHKWSESGAPTTFSAGLAEHAAGRSPALTLAMADKALYRAKVGGRDRIEVAGAPTRKPRPPPTRPTDDTVPLMAPR